MNCARTRTIFTQLKRLYFTTVVEFKMNVCVFSCGKKLWILTPGVSGRVWTVGSGSGFCLRILNILIFVFRSVQTEQISRRYLAPDKLIKKKQTSRVLKKSLDPDKKQVFLANIRKEKIRDRMFGKLIRNIIIIIIIMIRKTKANYETGFHSDSLICYT